MNIKPVPVPRYLRWTFSFLLAAMVIAVPYVCYRSYYEHQRRLRVVAPGVLYRSGRLTGKGLEEAIQNYKIRTVINLRNEAPDPEMPLHYGSATTVKERQICEANGARMIYLPVDLIASNGGFDSARPETIDRFLAIMDDPANHPVLIHCSAGLHRTGVLTAIYRMEYDGWSRTRAWYELRKNGFGESNCYSDNEYINQYIFTYSRGRRFEFTSLLPRPEETRDDIHNIGNQTPCGERAVTDDPPVLKK